MVSKRGSEGSWRYRGHISSRNQNIDYFGVVLRHDFTNHIQVLHGLLQLEKTDQARQYLSSLSKEVQAIKSLKLNIDHPGLSILLQTKKLTAQNHHIDMDFTLSQNDFNKIKTTDLIKILSNLIDNAIDLC